MTPRSFARASKRFNLAVAVDTNADRAAPIVEELGLELRKILEHVLSDPSIDAVSLATAHT